MKLKKSYTFLYVPEDHGPSRQFKVPRWVIFSSAGFVLFLGCVAILYTIGIQSGNSWLPGGSQLQKINFQLTAEITDLEGQVDGLRSEMDATYETRNLMASALNLPGLDEETYAAGIGGRGGLTSAPVEVPGLDQVLPTEALATDFENISSEVDLLTRQARIQQQGFLAMLDTLTARAEIRNHIPSIRPCDTGWLSSRFGFRKDPFTGKQTFHRGLDFSIPTGTPVRVTGDGVITVVQQQRGLGRLVKVDHGNGVMTVYAHLDKSLVSKGDIVKRGDKIALSGSSGRSTAPHLHYEIRVGGRAVNPLSYILDSYATQN